VFHLCVSFFHYFFSTLSHTFSHTHNDLANSSYFFPAQTSTADAEKPSAADRRDRGRARYRNGWDQKNRFKKSKRKNESKWKELLHRFRPICCFFFQLWLFEMDYRLPLLVIILLKVEINFLKKKKKCLIVFREIRGLRRSWQTARVYLGDSP
jgi:hypothetical protein